MEFEHYVSARLVMLGCGGGASGRATAFGPKGLGLNPGGAPGLNLGFFCFRCHQFILAGRRGVFLPT